MAPPRRVRDESLVLRTKEGAERVLHEERVGGYLGFDPLPTQRRFQVSRDARWLAYARPREAEVRLLRRDGAESTIVSATAEMRFSPDGGTLALVTTDGGRHGSERVIRKDLGDLHDAPWGDLAGARQIEFSQDGLVVLHAGPGGSWSALTLLPWSGAPRALVGPQNIERFVCAKAGRRVVYFTHEGVYAFDLDDAPLGEGAVRRLGGLQPGETSRNAEMSPDGARVLYATPRGVYRIDGNAAPALEVTEHDVHTIWFSPDGASSCWASTARAMWTSAEEKLLAAPASDLAAMRFVPSGSGLLVSRGRDAVHWSHRGEEVLATAPEGRLVLGADLFGGGLVLWQGAPWQPVFID